MTIAEFDHIAISAAQLADGVAAVEEALGVSLSAGGVHPTMGTHNRLLALGPGLYLEVIAIDPEGAPPGRPRWFDLDRFDGGPRLTNWICRTPDLTKALALAPQGAGTPMDLQRGDLSWRMAVPEDGRLPYDGAFPALIEWQGAAHPASRLPDAGCRLRRLEIAHPQAGALRSALAPIIADPRVTVVQGPEKAIRAEFDTPHGPRAFGP